MTIIQFLGTATAKFLESSDNDITVTKFMETALENFLLDDSAVAKLLQENDISVTKFLGDDNDISVTKFLEEQQDDNDISVTKFLDESLFED